ncbi:MAG: cobalamin B12-binding domain-containing protein [Planctomycetes bacterium]|nr:cobalamin B12-binding domain-containing protein [Planctomycetota bacterium]
MQGRPDAVMDRPGSAQGFPALRAVCEWEHTMSADQFLNRYMDSVLEGHRQACRDVLEEALTTGIDPRTIYRKIIWPAMENTERLYRADRINLATEHMATRISRTLADQLQAKLTRQSPNGKRVLITCADGEPEELGAQMSADLFEADGWDVYFVGGGVPNDEVLSLVGDLRPDMLVIFGTQPAGVANVRRLIDLVRQVGANPTMNIMISGGVFNRADGLWKEVNADLFAATAADALAVAAKAEPREPQVLIPGAPKKRRRRRRPPLLAGAEA